MPRTTAPPPRPALTRDRVLATAVELADRDGIDGLTMRKVGEALGVEAMSLYNHVANKGDLLDGMVDVVFAEIDLPTDPAVGWKEAMRTRCRSSREVLHRHPWAVALMDSRHTPGPANLRHQDAVLGVLIDAGLSLPLAGHAYATLDSYTYGFALQESVIPVTDAADTARFATEVLDAQAPGAYPNMARFTAEYVMAGHYEFAAEFDWGLDVVLDGIERAVAAERKGRRSRARQG